MDLFNLRRRIDEVRKHKARILSELEQNCFEGNEVSNFEEVQSYKFKLKSAGINEMKVACIMDDFTYRSFEPECSLMQITPTDWRLEMEHFNPDMFFIESAWRGINGLWNTKVAHLSNELLDIITYCKLKQVPVVFWNKEDPVHFSTFIETAKQADFVFTTDIDCINNYKTTLRHNRVFLMPFAAQPKYHNPVETHERKDTFCFAGAFYKRYPERIKDIETFTNVASRTKGIDIYDRNFNGKDPNYAFPSSYKKYIIGSLEIGEIDKAYKGYRYNINMNSVKQSQSMCARRVFELLASNTVTVSNYSKAIRNMLGDLVVCTDDEMYLTDQILKFNDDCYYLKYRLAGLRKVLSEHTYRKRFNYLIDKIFYNVDLEESIKIAVIAKVSTFSELKQVINNFNRQKYKDKELFVFSALIENDGQQENITFMSNISDDKLIDIQKEYDYCIFFSADDYYGVNYINDFVLSFEFTDSSVICKSDYYKSYNNEIVRINTEGVYSVVNSAQVRRSLIKIKMFQTQEIKKYIESINEATIEARSMSIDEFNYCMNYTGNNCEIVDDLFIADIGMKMDYLYNISEKIEMSSKERVDISINPNGIFTQIMSSNKVKFKLKSEGLQLETRLKAKSEYIFFNDTIKLDEYKAKSDFNIFLEVVFDSDFSLDVVVLMLDQNLKKVGSLVYPCNRRTYFEIDRQVKEIRLGFKIAGRGICIIKNLFLNNFENQGCISKKSDTLLISDNFPRYDDLYRSAFVFSRVKEYKNMGKVLDIFKYNFRYPAGYSEFNGIDITTGFNYELIHTLMYKEYSTILIHFLNENIWKIIKNFCKDRNVVIWVHGSDIQPWWRRKHNFSNPQQVEKARNHSEDKLKLWREVFLQAIRNKNVHFVFVSSYLAQTAFEDIKIELPKDKYSIIHNYINDKLFNYEPKDVEQRKRILSIRPYSNQNYANDLSIKAILHLSKTEIFKDLEFRIIGRGDLFKSTVKPLKKFKNVVIEEKFLRQEEISELHKEYGVFLIPTRMDTQGVSRDEAMASGLVPITNKVAAIPEFVDDLSGLLVEGEDYEGLANSIITLYYNPDIFQKLSKNAASRVREQSGINTTILKELEIINKPLSD